MFQENYGMVNACPMCLEGELKFVQINFQEEVKICMNKKCLYPFVLGAIDEFRPIKAETDEEDYHITDLAFIKKYEKSDLEWKKLLDDDFTSNKDIIAAREFASMLDELAFEKEVNFGNTKEGCLNIEELLDSFGDAPKTSTSTTVSEDPIITKLAQSNIDASNTEIKRNTTDENYAESFISELEKMQTSEKNQTDMQWDASDFNAETLEINNNVDKNVVASHSENHDLNVNVIAEQGDGVVTKAYEDVSPTVYHSVRCTSVTAKESKVQNDLSMNNSTSEVRTGNIVSENISPLSPPTNQTNSASTATTFKVIKVKTLEDLKDFKCLSSKTVYVIMSENTSFLEKLKRKFPSDSSTSKGKKDGHDSEITHISTEVATTASREHQSDLETVAAVEQASAQLMNVSEKPNESMSRCRSFLTSREKPRSQETTAAAVKWLSNNPKDPAGTAFSHTSACRGPGGLETAAEVEQASAQLNNKTNVTVCSDIPTSTTVVSTSAAEYEEDYELTAENPKRHMEFSRLFGKTYSKFKLSNICKTDHKILK